MSFFGKLFGKKGEATPPTTPAPATAPAATTEPPSAAAAAASAPVPAVRSPLPSIPPTARQHSSPPPAHGGADRQSAAAGQPSPARSRHSSSSSSSSSARPGSPASVSSPGGPSSSSSRKTSEQVLSPQSSPHSGSSQSQSQHQHPPAHHQAAVYSHFSDLPMSSASSSRASPQPGAAGGSQLGGRATSLPPPAVSSHAASSEPNLGGRSSAAGAVPTHSMTATSIGHGHTHAHVPGGAFHALASTGASVSSAPTLPQKRATSDPLSTLLNALGGHLALPANLNCRHPPAPHTDTDSDNDEANNEGAREGAPAADQSELDVTDRIGSDVGIHRVVSSSVEGAPLAVPANRHSGGGVSGASFPRAAPLGLTHLQPIPSSFGSLSSSTPFIPSLPPPPNLPAAPVALPFPPAVSLAPAPSAASGSSAPSVAELLSSLSSSATSARAGVWHGVDSFLSAAGGTMPASMRTGLEKKLISWKIEQGRNQASSSGSGGGPNAVALARSQSGANSPSSPQPTTSLLDKHSSGHGHFHSLKSLFSPPASSSSSSPSSSQLQALSNIPAPSLHHAQQPKSPNSSGSGSSSGSAAGSGRGDQKSSRPGSAPRREGEVRRGEGEGAGESSPRLTPLVPVAVSPLPLASSSRQSSLQLGAEHDGHWSTQYASRRARTVSKKPSAGGGWDGGAAEGSGPTAAGSPELDSSAAARVSGVPPASVITTMPTVATTSASATITPVAASINPAASPVHTPTLSAPPVVASTLPSPLASPLSTSTTSSPIIVSPASSSSFALTTPPHEWSVADVGVFLSSLGLGSHSARFERSAVDGDILLTLTETDLVELGVDDRFHRRKINKKLATITSKSLTSTTSSSNSSEQQTGGEDTFAPFLPQHRSESNSISTTTPSRGRHGASPSLPLMSSASSSSSQGSGSSNKHPRSSSLMHHGHESTTMTGGGSNSSSRSSSRLAAPRTWADHVTSTDDETTEESSLVGASGGGGSRRHSRRSAPHAQAESTSGSGRDEDDEYYVSNADVARILRAVPAKDRLVARERRRAGRGAGSHHAVGPTNEEAKRPAATGIKGRSNATLSAAAFSAAAADPYHDWGLAEERQERPAASNRGSGGMKHSATFAGPPAGGLQSSSSFGSSASMQLATEKGTSPPSVNRNAGVSKSPALGPAAVPVASVAPSQSHKLSILDLREILSLRPLAQGVAGVALLGRYGEEDVVVKQPRKTVIGSEEWLELQLHMQLPEHPRVVRFVGIVMVQLQVYFVTRFVARGSLKSLLSAPSDQGGDDLRRYYAHPFHLIRAASEIADGLAHLHAHHVVHRDVAARNVLVDADGRHVLSDLGLSRWMEKKEVAHEEEEDEERINKPEFEDVYTMSSLTALPARWTAPESLRSSSFTAASDLYSLGVTCWEMATGGATPFAGVRDNASVIIGVVTGELDLLSLLPADTAPQVRHFIAQALQPVDSRPSLDQWRAEMNAWIDAQMHDQQEAERRQGQEE